MRDTGKGHDPGSNHPMLMMSCTAENLRNAQEGSRRTCAARKESWRASRERGVALVGTRLAECGAELERVAAALYGPGRAIPPAEGGMLFREVCTGLQRRGYDITEEQLRVQAEKRGIWSCSVRDVINAHRPGAKQEPVKLDASLVPVPEPQACCVAGPHQARGLCAKCYDRWFGAARRARHNQEVGR